MDVQLVLHQRLGHIHGGILGSLVHSGLLKGAVGLLLGIFQSLGADVGLQLVQGVELGNVLGKLVVLLGNDGLGDLVQLDVEHDGLTGQLLVVVLGEGDVDVLLLTGAHADDLLLKTGNKLAGAQLQVKVVALAALEGYAIVETLEVDVGGVAHLGGTLHGLGGGDVLRHPIQLGLHLLVGDADLGLLHF